MMRHILIAVYNLILSMLKTTLKEEDNEDDSPSQSKASLPEPSSPNRALEQRVRDLEEQPKALSTASELKSSSDTALSDKGLQGTVSAAKDSVPVLPLSPGSPIMDDRAGPSGTAGADLSSPNQSLSDESCPETVEALKEVGRLSDRHESLETRVRQSKAHMALRTQIQYLQDRLTALGQRQIPDDVLFDMFYLRTIVNILLEDKAKSNQDTDASTIKQLTLQMSNIRTAVQKLVEKVLVLMREKREKERSRQYRDIQEQLNSLWVMIEDHVESSGQD